MRCDTNPFYFYSFKKHSTDTDSFPTYKYNNENDVDDDDDSNSDSDSDSDRISWTTQHRLTPQHTHQNRQQNTQQHTTEHNRTWEGCLHHSPYFSRIKVLGLDFRAILWERECRQLHLHIQTNYFYSFLASNIDTWWNFSKIKLQTRVNPILILCFFYGFGFTEKYAKLWQGDTMSSLITIRSVQETENCVSIGSRTSIGSVFHHLICRSDV